MVCNRCILVVTRLLEKAGFTPLDVGLGTAVVQEKPGRERREAFRKLLEAYGFELIDEQPDAPHRADPDGRDRIGALQRRCLESQPVGLPARRCHRDYSALSKLFSEVNGISIEKYFLAQRIERVKELLAYGDLTVSEIADKLRYSSVAHLSAQFRAQTGMSPTEFRRLKGRGLKPLDEV